jgi:hypothetical protein
MEGVIWMRWVLLVHGSGYCLLGESGSTTYGTFSRAISGRSRLARVFHRGWWGFQRRIWSRRQDHCCVWCWLCPCIVRVVGVSLMVAMSRTMGKGGVIQDPVKISDQARGRWSGSRALGEDGWSPLDGQGGIWVGDQEHWSISGTTTPLGGCGQGMLPS